MTTTAPRAAAAPPRDDRLDPALIKIGIVLVLGTIIAVLDSTVVNVGIEAIRRDFGSPLSTIQWISTGYLLAFALVAPMSGWATERFGAKRMWMASVAGFVLASALCGLAWSAPSLVAFRILQGAAGGLIQPIGQSMLAQAAGRERIGRVMGMLIIPLTFAPALGPVIGGILISAASWPWIFYLNLPLGALTLLLAARILPDAVGQPGQKLDVRGLLLISPGLAALIYGLSETANGGGLTAPRVLVATIAGLALLAGYTAHALKHTGSPLVDLRLFAVPSFRNAVASSFMLGAALFSSMFLLPLYYQVVRGQSPLHTGLLTLPQDFGIALSMFFVGRLTDKLGPRWFIVAGVLLAMAGTFVYTRVGSHPSEYLLGLGLFVRGVGMGAAMSPIMAAVFRSVQPQQMPQAAGTTNVLHRIGGSLGTALLAVVLEHQSGSHAPAQAFAATFWWAFALSALTLLPALMLPGRNRG
ncbi:MDR family MFS transporter [Kitasatospora azatica]|uniref:MDR family MFS transporter n=1 Tax=Kitasatospora azatica TaxID=58347 RepID=UPI0006916962|nr:MDR family MFS transporter [Kitasatospora azatica]